MSEMLSLEYNPQKGKFQLERNENTYLLTVQELVAMLRDFERQLSRGDKELTLKVGPERLHLEEAPIPIYLIMCEGFKKVWETFRRSRYGLETQ